MRCDDPADPAFFKERRPGSEEVSRYGDVRNEYQRDRARIIHSAAFRRLQGKTQVMGVGEGDFHRTRLTHSIECAQIGAGLLGILEAANEKGQLEDEVVPWLPNRDLIEAACFAHDLGHPPFGHGGERALHEKMHACGGFEGNGQTLRILTRLEKYREIGQGINPTRRLVLAVLKYPAPYASFAASDYRSKPPKCYFDEEETIVAWAMEGFSEAERLRMKEYRDARGRTEYLTLDCSLLNLADDIAYGVHDIEDITARRLVSDRAIKEAIEAAFKPIGGSIKHGEIILTAADVSTRLLETSYRRKAVVSEMVNLFVTAMTLEPVKGFSHPLLAFRAVLPEPHRKLLRELKKIAHDLVVRKANVQQLERRGQRVVSAIYDELIQKPEELIPSNSWNDLRASGTCTQRRVCDYIAGMTDSYAEKVFHRLFTPGFGSSGDEL
jgi:dGTPase